MRAAAAVLALLNFFLLTGPLTDLVTGDGPFSVPVLVCVIVIAFLNLMLSIQVLRKKTTWVRFIFYVNVALLGCFLLALAINYFLQDIVGPSRGEMVAYVYLIAHLILAKCLFRQVGTSDSVFDETGPGRAVSSLKPEKSPKCKYVYELSIQPPRTKLGCSNQSAFDDQMSKEGGDSPRAGILNDFEKLNQTLAGIFVKHGYSFKTASSDILKFFTAAALMVSHRRWYGAEKNKSDLRLNELSEIMGLSSDLITDKEGQWKFKNWYLNPKAAIEFDFDELEDKMKNGRSFESLQKTKIWQKSWTGFYLSVTEPLLSEISIKDWNKGINRDEMIYNDFKEWMKVIWSYWWYKDENDAGIIQKETVALS